jgi:hypothetical protein
MSKFFKYFEYAYIVFALLFIATGIYEFETNENRAYLMFGMAGVAVFIFFFKRHFRRKFENRER